MGFRNLLVRVGLAAGNVAAKFDPTGVAGQILESYEKHHDREQLRGELDEMMAAGFAQFRAELADAMGELKLELAESVRGQVEAYLSQFQASAKQAARMLGDPSATTVPATVAVDQPEQLAEFLPKRAPRFTVGHSVPGLPSWKLVEPLGAGGFGEVWKAENPYSGTAAFKFFLDPIARKRFTRTEAEPILKILREAPTDGVVKLLGAEPEQDPPWLQFEYLAGGDLSSLPEAWKSLPDAERVKQVHAVIRTLAATAGHFHKLNVVHRDLKPSNVLRRPDGSLVIADFGISRIVPVGLANAPTPLNSATATIRAYTALYASPQQKKFRPADRRDDVYALGVLWYQLLRGDLTLERPGGEGWKRALAKFCVPDAAITLLARCWDDEPDERPADGNALLAELGEGAKVTAVETTQPPVSVTAAETLPPPVKSAPAAPQSPKKRITNVRLPGEEIHFQLPGVLTMAFCWIPPGTAQLGSPKAEQYAVAAQIKGWEEWLDAESEIKRGVYTSKGFWLGKFTVTQAEWQAVTGEAPSCFEGSEADAATDPVRLPVEEVSWNDCQGFLDRLNSAVGAEQAFGRSGR